VSPPVVRAEVSAPEDEGNLRRLVGRHNPRSHGEVRFGVHDEINVVHVDTEHEARADEVAIHNRDAFERQVLEASVGGQVAILDAFKRKTSLLVVLEDRLVRDVVSRIINRGRGRNSVRRRRHIGETLGGKATRGRNRRLPEGVRRARNRAESTRTDHRFEVDEVIGTGNRRRESLFEALRDRKFAALHLLTGEVDDAVFVARVDALFVTRQLDGFVQVLPAVFDLTFNVRLGRVERAVAEVEATVVLVGLNERIHNRDAAIDHALALFGESEDDVRVINVVRDEFRVVRSARRECRV